MFIQVLQGRVTNPDGIRAEVDRWKDELQPGAEGWLGSTSGITDDGLFIAVVRFASEEVRRAEREQPAEADPSFNELSSLMTDLRYFDRRNPRLDSP